MSARAKTWWPAAAFWVLLGLLSGTQVWISMITHGHSVPRLIGYYVLVWAPWIGFSAIIVRLLRRWPPAWRRRGGRLAMALHGLAAVALALLHGSWWIALTVWMQPFDRMTGVYSRVETIAFVAAQVPVAFALYCGVAAAVRAADFYRAARQKELHAARLESDLVHARLQALELQLQPHFLFNTLHAIGGLVRTGHGDAAVGMIAGLSDLLRYTLDHAGGQNVALEDETAVLSRYLEIQQARFADRLAFAIEVAPEARRAAVPTLLLQPLAENAIRHGIAASASAGRVDVRAWRGDGELRIEMFNSGSLQVRPEGIGLRNTRERLRQLFGDEQRFELRSCSGGGVLASLAIPWRLAG